MEYDQTTAKCEGRKAVIHPVASKRAQYIGKLRFPPLWFNVYKNNIIVFRNLRNGG